jgi:uncharacterized protein (TIGR03437 family)
MRCSFGVCAWLLAAGYGVGFGQGPTLAGAGYADPSMIQVAPGQITTLFVTGLKTVLTSQVNATVVPLPTVLAGISVTLNQAGVPLLAIQQIPVCSGDSGSDCVITAITVQIPFELGMSASTLVVTENGNASKTFKVSPVADHVHVMTLCDVYPSPKFVRSSQPVSALTPACAPVATHANGDLITAYDPAAAGEEIVIWAFGLGATSPAVKTGTATPTPAPVMANAPLIVQFDARPNAGASRPYLNPMILSPFVPVAIFAGLTPGQVGLYQVNLKIPDTLSPVGACTTTVPGNALIPLNVVQSNLTINIGATTSFDGAAICVKN